MQVLQIEGRFPISKQFLLKIFTYFQDYPGQNIVKFYQKSVN